MRPTSLSGVSIYFSKTKIKIQKKNKNKNNIKGH
jgi:hypothetical protein